MLYFEDFEVGDVHELGSTVLAETEILEFGQKYDPQPFHTDPEMAVSSAFGGLVASGWHTAASFMRLYVERLLADSAGEGSPGVDELRFVRPVRAGDTLTARLTVLGTAPSLGRSDTGIVRPRCELFNQDGHLVLSMVLHSIFRRRSSEGA